MCERGATDNLKAGVTKACFYDPAINRTYADMAAHYDTAVVPARPHKPKDKAKVEGAVLLVDRWMSRWKRAIWFRGAPLVRRRGFAIDNFQP